METKFLSEFAILAETKNYWDASEKLSMNQSTLSKHIKSLEKELGVNLFLRTTRKVELTSYGKSYLPYAKSMTQLLQEGDRALKQIKSSEDHLLSIGSIPAMAQYGVTSLLARFCQKHPETSLRVLEEDSKQLPFCLENGSCDFIFLRKEKGASTARRYKQKMEKLSYLEDEMVAVLPKKHPLAAKENIRLEELRNEPFCLLKEGSFIYEMVMEHAREAGFIPNVIFTSHRFDAILDMVANQNCVALLMNRHLANYDLEKSPWIYRTIEPLIQTKISLCYLKDKKLSLTDEKFLRYFQKEREN